MPEFPGLELPQDAPWSYSTLNAFETCARNYGEVNVLKKFPFVESEAIKQGKQVHALLESYITIGSPLPPGLVEIKGYIDKMVDGAAAVQGEQSLNYSYDLQPCQVMSTSCSYRGKLDLTVMRPNGVGIVVDYKTSSSPRESMDQLEFAAVASLIHNPDMREVHAYFLYTKGFRPRKVTLIRASIPGIINGVRPRIERMALAKAQNFFPPTPCYVCRWCPILNCEFNESNNARTRR